MKPADVARSYDQLAELWNTHEFSRNGIAEHERALAFLLAGANAAEVGDLSPVILSHVGDDNRIFVDVHADEECARLRQS